MVALTHHSHSTWVIHRHIHKTPVNPRNSSTYGIAKFLNAQHAAALATREAEHGILVYPNKAWELEDYTTF